MTFVSAGLRAPILLAASLAAVGLLSACGGGGGGGGGSGTSYSVSPTSVTFSATAGEAAPAAKTVTVSVSGGSVFILTPLPMAFTSAAFFTADFAITGPTTGVITITPSAPVSAGTLTGTITVRGCSNAICTGPDVPGSPKTINVTYTIAPAPTITPSAGFFNFQVATGATPAPQSLSMTSPAGAVPWTSQIAYTSGTAGWLSLSQSSGTLPQTVSVNATSM